MWLNMQVNLIKNFFFLCVVHVYSKQAWVVPLKDKQGITISKRLFQEILDESGRKTKKIWVYKDGEFFNRSMKSWLQDNDIEMHLTHNEGKFVVAERFIRAFKNKIYKDMTSISNNVYIDELVGKLINTKHIIVKLQ